MRMPTLPATLRLDGAANLIGVVALAILAPTLAAPAGLAATWPLWLLAAAALKTYGSTRHAAASGRALHQPA